MSIKSRQNVWIVLVIELLFLSVVGWLTSCSGIYKSRGSQYTGRLPRPVWPVNPRTVAQPINNGISSTDLRFQDFDRF